MNFDQNINKLLVTCLRLILLVSSAFFLYQGASCQPGKRLFTVVFYNVENLYDIYDDPRVNDNEFLPGSKKQWTKEKYGKKLLDISEILAESGGNNLPILIGLCEVENRRVVEDLATSGKLKKGEYSVVHMDSPDPRGIDVALMYRKNYFTPGYVRTLPVILDGKAGLSTRDILYVKGTLNGKYELNILVNHWPSRIGGVQQTEKYRLTAASVVRSITDSLFKISPNAKIIVMGDLNDTPDNPSLRDVLAAVHPEKALHPSLVNLMYPGHHNGEGSYNYRGSWDMLDNLIVSSSLLKTNGLHVDNTRGFVFQCAWMTYTNPQGQQAPNRSYAGDRYVGGVSDHFPVFMRLVK